MIARLPKISTDFYNVFAALRREFRKTSPASGPDGPIMSPPPPSDRTDASATPRRWVLALVVLCGSAAVFTSGLASEPSFVDEWAYLSQTSYADLFVGGKLDHPAWLEMFAYDLPPLPKYLFGLALRAAGYPRPGLGAAGQWYRNTHSECGPKAMLVAARWPSVALGALGCVAVFGLAALAFGDRAGVLAALLLAINPLYRVHARRAMSDVPSECFILLSTLAALWAWRRFLAGRPAAASWLGAVLAGVCGGLAPLSKLNGALAMMIVAAWTLLALALPGFRLLRKLAVARAALVSAALALATFTALNPFLTAHPRASLSPTAAAIARQSLVERARLLVDYRVAVSRSQKVLFPHNALNTPLDKVAVIGVQGFGRFGPFGPHSSKSWIRYELAQDWGAALWLPVVASGAVVFFRRGRAQLAAGEPPAAWAILVQAVVTVVVVAAYLPLAWDRYFLSLQPVSAILAAGAVVTLADRIRLRVAHGQQGG
jgi:4-amino-4-deoxy-L-arabinose transferase-like glycosyltransferase